MDSPSGIYKVPIWLSDWEFIDFKKKKYKLYDVVVKGYSKEAILNDDKVVNKVVKKLIGFRRKHSLKPINLTLKSQHSFGVED